jgi:hypothetical protein
MNWRELPTTIDAFGPKRFVLMFGFTRLVTTIPYKFSLVPFSHDHYFDTL